MPRAPVAEQHLSDLAWLRRVRDRIDRERALPLDVEAISPPACATARCVTLRAA